MTSNATALAVLDPAMKVIANEPLVNSFLAESQLADLFTEDGNIQTDTTTGGRYIERAHIDGLPAGFGARAENDNLPEADDPSFYNTRIYLRSLYGVLEMTGHTMRRVVGDEGAFLNYAKEAFPLFAKRVGSEWDRMAIGFGAGILGRISATPTLVSTGVYTIPVTRAFGITGYTGFARLVLKGKRIVFSATAAGTALRNAGTDQSAKIRSVDFATDVATVEMSATLAAALVADDYVFSGDNAGTSSQSSGTNREPQGLLAGVDDGNVLATYLNKLRSESDSMRATVLDTTNTTYGSGGQMTEDLLVYGDEQVQIVSGGKIDSFVLSLSAKRGYRKSLKTDRVFLGSRALINDSGKPEPLSIDLGDRIVPFKVARKIPDECSFGLVKGEWKKHMLRTFDWDDKTGSIWNRVVTTSGRQDRFYAVGFTDLELSCRNPWQNIRFDNLARVY